MILFLSRRTRHRGRGFFLAALFLALTHAGAEAVEPTAEDDQARVQTERVDPEKSRGELLAELYGRLGKASDQQSAELIAAAIERLWLKSGSDTIDLLMSRVVRVVNDEDLDLALKLLDSVIALAPDFSEGWNQRATVYFLKRDYQRSLDDLRRVLRLDPRHFKAINGLGLLMDQLGDKPAALKAFREALKIHPHLDSARQSVKELTRQVEGQGI